MKLVVRGIYGDDSRRGLMVMVNAAARLPVIGTALRLGEATAIVTGIEGSGAVIGLVLRGVTRDQIALGDVMVHGD